MNPPNDSRAAHTPTETNQPLGWAERTELFLEIVNERARLRAENARLRAALALIARSQSFAWGTSTKELQGIARAALAGK